MPGLRRIFQYGFQILVFTLCKGQEIPVISYQCVIPLFCRIKDIMKPLQAVFMQEITPEVLGNQNRNMIEEFPVILCVKSLKINLCPVLRFGRNNIFGGHQAFKRHNRFFRPALGLSVQKRIDSPCFQLSFQFLNGRICKTLYAKLPVTECRLCELSGKSSLIL